MDNNYENEQRFYNPSIPEQPPHSTSAINEYSYIPQRNFSNIPPKKNKPTKKILAFVVAFVCVGTLIGTGFLGYSLITGNKLTENDAESQSIVDNSSTIDNSDTQQTNPATVNREIPTLVQLASLENALSIPEIVKKVSPSVVGISCSMSGGTATGTGFIISKDGYIVTNAHVVNGANAIKVVLSETYKSEEMTAELIGIDTQTDIAVLKINKTDLQIVELGKSSDLVVGELAISIGNPLGFELSGTVTAGIISALDRTLTIEDREMNLIQTDASINSGNSGGPLINSYGQVVGMTSAKVASSYGEGLGFAIPIDEVLPIVKDLIAHGYVKGRPIIGLSGETISDVYAQFYDIPQGFIVRTVNPGSPAEKAGIVVGDIVIGIEGKLINSIAEFNEVKAKYKAGDTITISLYREKKITDIKLVLAEDISATNTDSSNNNNSQNNNNGYDDFDYYNRFRDFGY